jgi:hypothetical protein
MAKDFLDMYLQYTADTEATATFHRWSAIVGVGAYLERNVWIQHGASQHFPNHYTMLLGESGSRKSAAIKGFVRILKEAGYKTLAAEKTSKEKFSQDLAAAHRAGGPDEDISDELIFGSKADNDAITPVLIACDEANDFFGLNNIEFLSLLGSWWDYSGTYDVKYKTSKSDSIPNPTVSILAGNTPTNFSLAFPPAIIGQGFFSRILLIHGERTRPKITWPTPPDPADTAAVVQALQGIKNHMMGEIQPTPGAKLLVDAIYKQPDHIQDERFASYFNRRLTHLLKLSLVIAACKFEKEITEDTIIQANTYLTYIQNLMPKALGEYGRSADSPIIQKLMQYIQRSPVPLSMKDLAKQVTNDIQNLSALRQIIEKLVASDKVEWVGGGLVASHQAPIEQDAQQFTDFNRYLTPEELGVKAT